MIFQACLVILIAPAAIFVESSSAGVNFKVSRRSFDGERRSAIVDGEGRPTIVEGGEGRNPRPNTSFTLDDAIARDVLNAFNRVRSLVGASNMNYVSWALYLESAVIAWANGCNFDAAFYLPVPTYNLRLASESNDPMTQVIREFFNSTDLYYGMRSTHVTGICAVKMFCSKITVYGKQYSDGYLYIASLPYASGFNASVPQYTLGPPCSNCLFGVEWCYNNLCREDCDFRTFGCCKIMGPGTFECAPSAPALAVSRSHSCRINPSVTLEIPLLGLLSVLFAFS